MPESKALVINTGPLLALIAGTGDLSLLGQLYKRVLVPFEVCVAVHIIPPDIVHNKARRIFCFCLIDLSLQGDA
ncbi:conserved hypothetical protein [delta proteobacterium NaphS2]|nr:conserved hypothetical protein [delta proteobacterium NaphS2]